MFTANFFRSILTKHRLFLNNTNPRDSLGKKFSSFQIFIDVSTRREHNCPLYYVFLWKHALHNPPRWTLMLQNSVNTWVYKKYGLVIPGETIDHGYGFFRTNSYGNFSFNQKFRQFPEVVEFLQSEPFNRKFRDMFRLSSSTYILRGHNMLCLSKLLTTSYGINSFSYLAAISWNSLPDHNRTISDFTFFRRLISTGNKWSCPLAS